MLTLTFRPNGTYACPGLGSTRDLAVFSALGLPPVLEQRGCSDCPVFTSCHMSHWTRMSVDISDVPALQQAAEELGCTFQRGGIGLGYQGRTLSGDFVLKTPRPCPYDIVATRNAEGKLDLDTDWYQGHVARVVGENYGKLLQHYGIAKAEIAAHAEGYLTTREHLENGDLKLHIEILA
jgi:hypothetical protein